MVLNNGKGDNKGIINNARSFLGKKEVKYFVGGMIAAVAIKKIAETEIVREAAVNLTAETLNIKDSIEEQIEVYGPEDIDEEIKDLEDEAEVIDE